jgi:hypothetical protein
LFFGICGICHEYFIYNLFFELLPFVQSKNRAFLFGFIELSNWRIPARLCWLCAWAFGGRFASVDSLGQSCVGIYLRWLLLIALNGCVHANPPPLGFCVWAFGGGLA